MSALFDFNAFLIVVLLTICTCTYVKTRAPRLLSVKTGWGVDWQGLYACRGRNLSPCTAALCCHARLHPSTK